MHTARIQQVSSADSDRPLLMPLPLPLAVQRNNLLSVATKTMLPLVFLTDEFQTVSTHAIEWRDPPEGVGSEAGWLAGWPGLCFHMQQGMCCLSAL